MQYHIHDKGPAPSWLARLLRWDCRYSVCEGPPHDDDGVMNCRFIHVAASMREVRKVIRKHELERRHGRTKPYFKHPSTEVKP